MITLGDFYHVVEVPRPQKVYENADAVLLYFERRGEYMAIDKNLRGEEYGKYPQYYRSTSGTFKKCKAAFEKYSQNAMAWMKQ